MPDLDALINDIDKRSPAVATAPVKAKGKTVSPVKDYAPPGMLDTFLDQLGISHGSPWSGLQNAGKFYGTLAKDLVVTPLAAAGRFMADPVSATKDMVGAQKGMYDQAADDINNHQGVKAFGHTLAGTVPIVGPFAGGAGDKIGTPDTLSGAADATASILPMFKGGRGALKEMTLPEFRRMGAERLAASGAGVDRVGEYGSRPASAVVDNTGPALSSGGRLDQIINAKNNKLATVRQVLSAPVMETRPSQMFDAINSAADNVKSFVTQPGAMREIEALRQKAINRALETSIDGKGTHYPDGVLDMRQWADKGVTGDFGGNPASISKQFYQSLRGNLKNQLNQVAPEVAPLNNEVHSLIDAEEQATQKFNAEGKKPVLDTSSIPNMVKSLVPGKTLAGTGIQKLLSLGTKEDIPSALPNVPMIKAGDMPGRTYDAGDFSGPKVPVAPVASQGSYTVPESHMMPSNVPIGAGPERGQIFFDPRTGTYISPDPSGASTPWAPIGPTNWGFRPDEMANKSFNSPQPPVGGNAPNYTTGPTAEDIGLAHDQGGIVPAFDNAFFRRTINSTPEMPADIVTNPVNSPAIAPSSTPSLPISNQTQTPVAGAAESPSLQGSTPYNSPAPQIIPDQAPQPAPARLTRKNTVRSSTPVLANPDISSQSPYSPLGKSTLAGGYGFGSAPAEPAPMQPPPVLQENLRPISADVQPGEKAIVNGRPVTIAGIIKKGGKTTVKYHYRDNLGFLTYDEKEFGK